MADINELKQNRASLVAKMRTVLNEVEKREDKTLTAEDKTKYNAMETEVENLSDQIKREEELRNLERNTVATNHTAHKPEGGDAGGKTEKRELFYKDSDQANAEFRKWLTNDNLRSPELRALQADIDTTGGYIVTPQQFMTSLIQEKDNMTFMRRLARTFQVPRAESLGVPTLENDPADPTWTPEIGTGDEDSTMSFGKREFFPHNLAKRIKVSNTLIRKSVLGPEALVRQRMAYKFAVTEEANYMTGNGAGKPLGIFIASNNGIGTGRDVSNGNTTTEIRTDNLHNVVYSLKKQYRSNCVWIFHRDAIKMIRKLKDGNGRYIWEASITANQPDRLLGFPIEESEYAPNTFTTGLYVGILGDMSYYWIVDALSMTMQKLVELYAETNQVGFIARAEIDGMPVLQNAFARVKLA